MKKNRPFILLFAFMICFGLVWPLVWPIDGVSAQSRAKRGARKKSGAKKSARGKSRRTSSRSARGGRSGVAATPRPAFDKIMSENRALLSEATDAESAASQIDENKLRSHVKYLADDLLEGRGPGSRGGMLAAKYIAAQFEALGLEPAAADRSFFQQAQMIGTRTDPSTKLTVKSDAAAAEFKFGDEFVAGTDLEQAEIPINSEIISARYGVRAEPLRRQSADLLRPVDVQVRRGGAARRCRRDPDSHRQLGRLRMERRAKFVGRRPVRPRARSEHAVVEIEIVGD